MKLTLHDMADASRRSARGIWEPEIEKFRQNFRHLAEKSGSGATATELSRTIATMEEDCHAPTRDSHAPDFHAAAAEWLRRASAV